MLIDGRRTMPADVQRTKVFETRGGVETLLSMVVHEGRNRQVRKMCEAVGHPVVRLRRVAIGSITDSRLRPGDFRELSEEEVATLKKNAGRPRTSPAPAASPARPRTPARRNPKPRSRA